MTKIKTYSDILGWTATAAILSSAIATAAGYLTLGPLYFGIGVILGIMMAIHGWERKSPPVVGLNGTYAVINLFGLARVLLS